jgi:hypothetical protein
MTKQNVQLVDDSDLRRLQVANKELLAQKAEMERFASFLLLNPDPIIELDTKG